MPWQKIKKKISILKQWTYKKIKIYFKHVVIYYCSKKKYKTLSSITVYYGTFSVGVYSLSDNVFSQ